eukprot:6208465-Pleurochrysis_carterae.AAC.1
MAMYCRLLSDSCRSVGVGPLCRLLWIDSNKFFLSCEYDPRHSVRYGEGKEVLQGRTDARGEYSEWYS